MPLAIPGRTKDAVVVAAADSDWRAGVEAFLREVGADDDRARYHLNVLDQRAAGRMSWISQFADRTLSSGRPMPASRAYAQSLVNEGMLPLYDAGGWVCATSERTSIRHSRSSWACGRRTCSTGPEPRRLGRVRFDSTPVLSVRYSVRSRRSRCG